MIVTVSGLSGLTNAYRSVLSATGSLLISGASRWDDTYATPPCVRAASSRRLTRARSRYVVRCWPETIVTSDLRASRTIATSGSCGSFEGSWTSSREGSEAASATPGTVPMTAAPAAAPAPFRNVRRLVLLIVRLLSQLDDVDYPAWTTRCRSFARAAGPVRHVDAEARGLTAMRRLRADRRL